MPLCLLLAFRRKSMQIVVFFQVVGLPTFGWVMAAVAPNGGKISDEALSGSSSSSSTDDSSCGSSSTNPQPKEPAKATTAAGGEPSKKRKAKDKDETAELELEECEHAAD